MSTSPPEVLALLPGTEVHARGLRWEVVLTQPMGEQTLLRLRGLEGAFLGTEFDLLHPFERIEAVIQDLQPERAARLPDWLVYHQGFLLEQALGSHSLLATQPGRLRLEPYQLVPVLRAIRMSRPRLLLADGVGLGKTVQAGLILTELMARRIAHRILIVSPAGPLLEQWRTEMLERFGLRATVIDRTTLDEIRKGAELGAIPFDHIAIGLSSMDFLKQESVLELLEKATYDVVVIDEAHHCMDSGASGEREDSLRRHMAEVLSRRSDSLILATATPHDGHDRSFASLCELLDYSLVDGRGSLRGTGYRAHVVRRLKDHIKDPVTGEPRFKKRIVTPVPVTAGGDRYRAFRALQRGVVELVAPELLRALRARHYDDVLSFIALLKRSVSSVAACRSTLGVVLARYSQLTTEREETQESRRQRLRTLRDYNRKLEQFGSLTAEEEHERELLEAEDLAQSLVALQREVRSGQRRLKQISDLRDGLTGLLELADAAVGQDPKSDQIQSEIEAIRQKEPDANVLVYTEYTTTQDALVAHLQSAELGDVIALSGEDRDRDRTEKTERFRTGSKLVMVSTDAAAEGLNLHQRCHHLLHVELPFNPNRLEQRNGRIDRYGQHRNPIVRYLYLTRSFEERILLRLIAKYERQRSRLTFVPNTLGRLTSDEATNARLLQGLAEEEGWLLKEDPTPYFTIEEAAENEGADEATRELLEEIDRSLSGFERAARTNSWIADAGLNAEQSLVAQADTARERGSRESTVDLARFVANAVMLDGGNVEGQLDDPYFTVELPPTWSHGLGDLPGYDPETRRLLLTIDLEVTRTEDDKTVAFMGRAHPLVRRAIDRVRHLSFGGESRRGLDIRVSAMETPVSRPSLLLTYLGKVMSRAGREYERVIALRIDGTNSPEFHADAADWMDLVGRGEAISPRDVWTRHFGNSWLEPIEHAHGDATRHFAPLAAEFVKARRIDMEKEQTELEGWLRQRSTDVTGAEAFAAEQLMLEGMGRPAEFRPAWLSLADPRERLAAYVADGSRPPSRRSEADGVLRLYEQRSVAIEARLALGQPEVVPLGMLMLLPLETKK